MRDILVLVFFFYSLGNEEDALLNGIHQSVFMSSMVPNPAKDLPLCWEQHSKLLPGVDKIRTSDVSKWTMDEVANFVHTLPGCREQGKVFKEEVMSAKQKFTPYLQLLNIFLQTFCNRQILF